MRKGILPSVGADFWIYLASAVAILLFFGLIAMTAKPRTVNIRATEIATFHQQKMEAFLQLPYTDTKYNKVKVWQALSSQADLLDGQTKKDPLDLEPAAMHKLACSVVEGTCMWTLNVASHDGVKHTLRGARHAGLGENIFDQTISIPAARGMVAAQLIVYNAVEDVDINLGGSGP
ncbi:hypothetical protein CMO91_01335 [Candidatus Woesearchaeota archaeon]|nr:hypothetical protein [Candidatus Woesearchaeota archaeon]